MPSSQNTVSPAADALAGDIVNVYRDKDIVEHVLSTVGDASALRAGLTDYLLLHGQNDTPNVFDIKSYVADAADAKAVRQALVKAKLSFVSHDNAEAAATQHAHGDDVLTAPGEDALDSLALSVHPAGTIARAVATGYALKLLLALRLKELPGAVKQLDPLTSLENEFYIKDQPYYSVDEAVKAASKRLSMSVANLPDEVFFEIAEGMCLYNKAQYWALMSTGELQLSPLGHQSAGESPAAENDGKAPKGAARLAALWRHRWYDQLEGVRRVFFQRDFGAFLADSPYLVLAGRFAMQVPEFPALKPEDRQGNIFEDILYRVDRFTVQRFAAFLQRAEHSGRCEYAVRQAKSAGVLRAIGDAIGNIKTPIKTVDLCFQALTIVAQHAPCNRSQALHFTELYSTGFAGDLLEHGFVTGSGRGDGDGAGITIPSLITKSFLHRRDAWAVLSQLHPTFVQINERLVQEASRRALPKHFAAASAAQASSTEAGCSPTHYKSSDDLFMVASASVILSNAVTNHNAKRNQILTLRPCVDMIISNITESLTCAHCKIPGWDAQQRRYALASIRMLCAVVRDFVETDLAAGAAAPEVETKERTLEVLDPVEPDSASPVDVPEVVPAVPLQRVSSPFIAPENFALGISTILRSAPLVSCLMSGVLQLIEICSTSKESLRRLIGDDVRLIVDAIRCRFIDEGFDERVVLSSNALLIKEDVIRRVITILSDLCIRHEHSEAGSILVSLGVHHCADWGIAVTQCTNTIVSENNDPEQVRGPFAARLAATMSVVYKELFEHADVTAIAPVTELLLNLLRAVPTTVHTLDAILPRCIDWLKKDVVALLESEDADDTHEEEEAALEKGRRLHTSRNQILCGLLEVAKTLTAELLPEERTTAMLVELVEMYLSEVPYLTQVLQCLCNVVSLNGIKKSALSKEQKAIIRSAAETSKANNKLVNKIFTVLEDKDSAGKPSTSAPTHNADDKRKDQRESGETDRMEYLSNSENIFQRLVATPSSSSKAAPKTSSEPSASLSVSNVAKHGAQVPKGFTLVQHKASKSSQPSALGKNTAVRSAAGKAKDAKKIDEERQPRQDRRQQQTSAGSENSSKQQFVPRSKHEDPAAIAPDRNSSEQKRPPSTLVSVKGDAGGINLDLLSAKIATSLARKTTSTAAEQSSQSKPSSWASMAKCAKTPEERQAEREAEEREQEAALMKAAAEKAEMRHKMQQEAERKAQETQTRLRQLEADIRRNKGSVDATPQDASTQRSRPPASVDVHALLNKILPKNAHVRREEVRPVSRLPTIDDDVYADESMASYSVPKGSTVALSLAQLRIGEDSAPVIRTAPSPALASAPASATADDASRRHTQYTSVAEFVAASPGTSFQSTANADGERSAVGALSEPTPFAAFHQAHQQALAGNAPTPSLSWPGGATSSSDLRDGGVADWRSNNAAHAAPQWSQPQQMMPSTSYTQQQFSGGSSTQQQMTPAPFQISAGGNPPPSWGQMPPAASYPPGFAAALPQGFANMLPGFSTTPGGRSVGGLVGNSGHPPNTSQPQFSNSASASQPFWSPSSTQQPNAYAYGSMHGNALPGMPGAVRPSNGPVNSHPFNSHPLSFSAMQPAHGTSQQQQPSRMPSITVGGAIPNIVVGQRQQQMPAQWPPQQHVPMPQQQSALRQQFTTQQQGRSVNQSGATNPYAAATGDHF